jgi:hypothetical protein
VRSLGVGRRGRVTLEQIATVIHDTVVGLQADGFDEDEGRYRSVLAIEPATTFDQGQVGSPEHPGLQRHTFRLRPRTFSGHWLDHSIDPI